MSRLTTVLRSEKWVVRRFRRCANIIECTYTNLDRCAFKKKMYNKFVHTIQEYFSKTLLGKKNGYGFYL